ncbi:MAG: hypothetical protein U1C96_12010 [Gallionella sp.]|nr:hypothetical protein [Gallionella sp.]
MQILSRYSDQFIEGLRFLAKLNKAYRKSQPNFAEIGKIILSHKTGELKPAYDELREKLLRPLAENYLDCLGNSTEIANRCHVLSHGFLEIWGGTKIGRDYPLSVTIGNVFYRDENIYNLSKSSLKRILNEGKRLDTSLNVHVWLTWDDMTVVDLSIVSTLVGRGKLAQSEVDSLALIWTEEAPGDYRFEPILVDNDFFNKVDDGHLICPWAIPRSVE